MEKIETIGVVGGGTAGYLTALTLNALCPELRVNLVESSKIPVIGVGESTTPKLLRMLHDVLGFDLSEFYDAELNLLHNYVSKCWNDVKIMTKSTVKAIMNESTGAGEIYYLDENRYLKDNDERNKLTTHNKI